MIVKDVNGEQIQFEKAQRSHLDGQDCLYMGQGSNGQVYIFESDNPDVMISTTTKKANVFFGAVAAGEYSFLTMRNA